MSWACPVTEYQCVNVVTFEIHVKDIKEPKHIFIQFTVETFQCVVWLYNNFTDQNQNSFVS